MKILLLFLILLSVIFSKAQTCSLQVGAVTSFLGKDEFDKNEIGFGGELAVNIQLKKIYRLGRVCSY